MYDPHPDLTESVIFGLGAFYLLLFAMNACWTFRSFKQGAHVRIRLLGLLGEGVEIPRATSWYRTATTIAYKNSHPKAS